MPLPTQRPASIPESTSSEVAQLLVSLGYYVRRMSVSEDARHSYSSVVCSCGRSLPKRCYVIRGLAVELHEKQLVVVTKHRHLVMLRSSFLAYAAVRTGCTLNPKEKQVSHWSVYCIPCRIGKHVSRSLEQRMSLGPPCEERLCVSPEDRCKSRRLTVSYKYPSNSL